MFTNFRDMMINRESCRNYIAEKRPTREQLERIIDTARLSPSACNSQPWKFFIVNNADVSKQLAGCLQGMGLNKHVEDCPAFIVICEESAKLSRRVLEKYARQHFAQIDIGIVTHAVCLAAVEEGLSTCIMGWMNEKAIKKILNIGDNSTIRLVISIGYSADETIREKKRKDLEEIMEYIG